MILWLDRRLPASRRALVGPKAASLCTLRRLRLPVPPAFFVTTVAFREHLETNSLRSRIVALADSTPPTLEEIRQFVSRTSLPDRVREQIATAYHQLGATAVAVRSSATAEDLPGHSFAGQYETVLGVTSLEDCLDAIKKCWASLWTERAFEYRRHNGIDHRQVEMAVIVQEQIEPDAAGVAFSLDPVTGSRSRIVIESCRGLGDVLVSGQVQPDRLILRKKTLELIRRNSVTNTPSLDSQSARTLARSVRRIERRLESPQDIEWAIHDGTLWFLQARPVTAIPQPTPWEDRQVWTNLNLGEVAPDVMTPMTYSVILPMFQPLFGDILRLFGADPRRSPLMGLVAGRLYFSINVGLAVTRPFISPARAAAANSAFGGEQIRGFERGEFDICEEDLPDVGFSWPRYILSWPRIIGRLITHRTSRMDRFVAHLRAYNDAVAPLTSQTGTTEELVRTARRMLFEAIGDCTLLYFWSGAIAMGVLRKACCDWLADNDEGVGYRLLTAQGGMADVEAAFDLWHLAALAHEDKETEAALSADDPWGVISPRLRSTGHGRQFLAAWDRFMATHGHHSHSEIEFFSPRWSEMPDYILHLVRGYLRSIDQTNPVARQRQLAEQRDRLAEQCRRKLTNPIKRRLFDWSLRHTGKLARVRENSKSEAVRLIAGYRRLFLELGERLWQQGVLADRQDIFFLEAVEVEPIVRGRADFDVRQRIAQRRAEYERNMALTPPPVVMGRYDPHKHVAFKLDASVKVLKGLTVSPGVATGKARVIMQPNDGQHVEPGEILVAPITNPAWTPYFLTAAGVVMDMGGILSHGAVIAREYGIPAVVNVGPASQLIRTGQTICVDATRGIVTILDPA